MNSFRTVTQKKSGHLRSEYGGTKSAAIMRARIIRIISELL